MVCTYRVGAGTGQGAKAYARYVIEGALASGNDLAASYYAGDVWDRDVPETAVQLRADMSATLAERLGIDVDQPLSLRQVANLMNNLTADGREIEGKKKHSPHQSVASVFGLDLAKRPTEDQLLNVLAGKRADGTTPLSESQKELSEERVASALRKFKMAIGIPTTRDALPEEIERVVSGEKFPEREYLRQIAATTPPVGFVDFTFSADKSVSICYALAQTEWERQAIQDDVRGAVADAMAYVENVLGSARQWNGGKEDEPERADMAWFGVQHTTSRPAVDIVRTNAHGEVFTDTRAVPGGASDPHLHYHQIVMSSVLSETGRIGSLDLSRLEGEVKAFGAVFHAAYATRARKRGIDVVLGPNGEARISDIQEWIRTFYSRRTTQGEESARAWAASLDSPLDWDALSNEQRAKLVADGAAASRQPKPGQDRRKADEGQADIRQWQADAAAAGYIHRSVLRPDAELAILSDEQRIEVAREASLKLLDEAFTKDAVLPEGALREIAARGLIVSGLGARPAQDIDAVIQTYRDQGITVAGKPSKLVWGVEHGADGRPRPVVSTWHNINQEKELIGLVQGLSADRAGALTTEEIEAAAQRFLVKYPKIDPSGAQWRAGLAMAHTLGEGPRMGLAIGVAGSGKTASVVGVLTDAWHAQGKKVVAMTVPWRATQPLKDAGVDDAMAVDAFVRRVEGGKLQIDENTVIVADEVSMIGVRQQLDLLRLAEKHGARVIQIGDPRQCGAVETPALDLIAKAIGDDNIPKLLTTIRQASQRHREIAGMFRDGRAEEGLAAMRQDGDVDLVAGGVDPTIQHVVASWRRRMDANVEDPDYSLIVMAPTNARVLDIGKAIREDRRLAGEIGKEEIVVRAQTDKAAATVDLPLSVGDRIRPFQRLYDADTGGRDKSLASNGDIIEITALLEDGLRVRNGGGEEGRITWKQLKPFRAPKSDPVQLTYGYASSIDSAQSLTRSEAILALPDGSASVGGNKAYTALSRHVHGVELIASDAAERRQIMGRQMLGAGETPREADVIRNIAANLSRFQKRRLATEMHHQERAAARRSAKRRRQDARDSVQPPRAPKATRKEERKEERKLFKQPDQPPRQPASTQREALRPVPKADPFEQAIRIIARGVVDGVMPFDKGVDILMDAIKPTVPKPTKEDEQKYQVWDDKTKTWRWTRDLWMERESKLFEIEIQLIARLDTLTTQLMQHRQKETKMDKRPETRPTLTQAQRDAARQSASPKQQKQAQREALRQHLQQQQRLGHNQRPSL